MVDLPAPKQSFRVRDDGQQYANEIVGRGTSTCQERIPRNDWNGWRDSLDKVCFWLSVSRSPGNGLFLVPIYKLGCFGDLGGQQGQYVHEPRALEMPVCLH